MTLSDSPLDTHTFLPLHWDIFCRVIDNFGDAGVCWRMSQQLTNQHQQIIHLWIDDLKVLAAFVPAIQLDAQAQTIDGVVVHHWTPACFPNCDADVVIEAFACELPVVYLQSMSRRDCPPCWINVEYLSAESWVEDCHQLMSPHPTLNLKKYFFFPGFTNKTGGLLWGPSPVLEPSFFSSLGIEANFDGLTLSFFAYDHVSARDLVSTWQESHCPIRCLVPPGKPRHLLESATGLQLEQVIQCGRLTLIPLPFLSQDHYDRLLLSCDLNFVRGEDSFVRAQWAGKLFVWQIYPQDKLAHIDKLDAFLEIYVEELPSSAATVLRNFHHYWNAAPSADILVVKDLWNMLVSELSVLSTHATRWAAKKSQNMGLAESLMKFAGQNQTKGN